MTLPEHFLAIDEEGFALMNEIRVTDPLAGHEILTHLQFAENRAFVSQMGGAPVIVEAFDEPFVVQMIDGPPAGVQAWTGLAPYQTSFQFFLGTLSLDQWDRFHGLSESGIPFIFTRKAQAAFFDLLDEFDDDSVTFRGQRYRVKPWLSSEEPVSKESFWTQLYETKEDGWELENPSPVFLEMLPRMKLPKSRVLVLGCGSGNDAAYFAEQGHVVTAVDFSQEAISRGQAKYGKLANLKFVQSDLFKLDPAWTGQFDIIIEHTCYCAIDPERRDDLVKIWRRCLAPGGQILGVFFVMEKRKGPPYGGSEWEIRQRLQPYFQFHFWGRWRQSKAGRQGKELFVFASLKA